MSSSNRINPLGPFSGFVSSLPGSGRVEGTQQNPIEGGLVGDAAQFTGRQVTTVHDKATWTASLISKPIGWALTPVRWALRSVCWITTPFRWSGSKVIDISKILFSATGRVTNYSGPQSLDNSFAKVSYVLLTSS